MYIAGFSSLHFALYFDETVEGTPSELVIPKWRAVFRGVRRHKHVPEEVLHYHRSTEHKRSSVIETLVEPDGLFVLFTAKDEEGSLHKKFDAGLDRLNRALQVLPDLAFPEIRFILEVALNAPEGSTPIVGQQLFHLPDQVRRFGNDYDVSVSFRWEIARTPQGTLVVNILPMDSKAKHVHGRYSFRARADRESGSPFLRDDVLQTVQLMKECFEHVPELVTAAHLAEKGAERVGDN